MLETQPWRPASCYGRVPTDFEALLPLNLGESLWEGLREPVDGCDVRSSSINFIRADRGYASGGGQVGGLLVQQRPRCGIQQRLQHREDIVDSEGCTDDVRNGWMGPSFVRIYRICRGGKPLSPLQGWLAVIRSQ